jgi:branched chain amino acid efflux pump
MTKQWMVVLLVGMVTMIIKSAGSLFSGRSPRWIAFLPSALFAALIATQVFTRDQELTVDARAAGLFAAIIALLLRARPIVVLVAACAVTAMARCAF